MNGCIIIEKNKKYPLKHDTVYILENKDLSCGVLNHDEMVDSFKNASPASFYIENCLAKIFSKSIERPTKGNNKIKLENITIYPDFLGQSGLLYDQKAITIKGGDVIRSSYKGVGRKLDEEKNTKWVKAQHFIFTDFRDMTYIRIIAISGVDIIKRYPNFKISKKQIDGLFTPNKTK